MKPLLLLSLTLFFNYLCAQAPATATVDAGKLRINLTEDGRWGTDGVPFAEWLNEEEEYVPLMKGGGVWLTGRDPSGVLLEAIMNGLHNRPGTGNPDVPLTGIWRVDQEDINNHIQDFLDNFIIDDPIPAIYNWPGRGNPHFEQTYGYSLTDDTYIYAPFRDENADGMYNPDDGDYPFHSTANQCHQYLADLQPTFFWQSFNTHYEDGNTIIQFGQTTSFFTCADGVSFTPGMDFVNVDVVWRNLAINDFVSTRVSFEIHSQIGDSADDYLAVVEADSSNRRTKAIFFNETNTDPYFQGSPPVIGLALSWGPTDNFGALMDLTKGIPLYSNPLDSNVRTPSTVSERNYFGSGSWVDGTELSYGGLGYGQDSIVDLPFTGNVLANTGWTAANAGLPAEQLGVLISTGEMTMTPGTTQRMDFLIGALQQTQDNLTSVYTLKDTMELMANVFSSGCTDPNPYQSIFCQETSLKEELLPQEITVFPNPATNQLKLAGPANEIQEVFLYDLNGRLWLQTRPTTRQAGQGSQANDPMNIAHLPAGLYLVKVLSEKGSATARFVKQ